MEISLFDRDTLYNRHQFSHQQIDELLGESHDQLVLDEKISQLSQLPEFLDIAGSLDQGLSKKGR